METQMQCPRCQTDLISSFPFGFITKPVGPSITYVCTGCKFLFAKGADLDKQDFGFAAGDSDQESRVPSQAPHTPPNFLLKSFVHKDLIVLCY